MSRALSLPLLIVVAPARAAWLAGVACAVSPVPVSRYVVVTLSLWSWSIMVNDRVVGHACPVLGEVPAAGTTSLPCCSARKAAWKKAVPSQKDTWPKIEPLSPFTQRPWRRALAVAPTWVRFVPLNPKSIVTTAPAGSTGTTGVAAGCGALGDDQRLVHAERASGRVEDRGLDERAQVGRVGHVAARLLRCHPGRAFELVRRGQALGGQRVGRDDDAAANVGRGGGGRGGGRRRARRSRGRGALADGVAVAPAADCLMTVFGVPLLTARMTPSVRPSAIGMARGTAIRAARLRGRRHAGLCLVRMQSTSMCLLRAPGRSR